MKTKETTVLGKRKQAPDYIRYSSAGIQMVLVIGFFVWIGTLLDTHFETETAYWTAGLSLLGVICAVVYMVVSFNRISKK